MLRMYKLGLILSAVLGAGCSDSSDQMDARDEAVKHVCDRAQACGEIGSGSGAMYSSRDDCEVEQRSLWQKAWPPSECDGKIGQTQLDACLVTLDGVRCDAFVADFGSAAIGNCAESKVCSGTSSK